MALTYIRYASSTEPPTPPSGYVYEWYDPADRQIKYKLDDGTIVVQAITSTDDLPEGVTNLYFTTERAQDAVGAALTNTTTIDLTYNDPGNQITADINALSITNSLIANSTIDLTTKVTGALPIANGGTGQITANPAFNALSPLTTKGDVLSFSTVNARLGVGTNGQVLTADSAQTLGIKWATPAATGLTSINSDVTAAQLISTGTAGTDFAIVDAGSGSHVFNLPTASATNTGKLSSSDWTTFNGKLTSPLTTKGDVLGFSSVNARIPVGSNGQVLTADSTQTLGLKWATPAATGLTSINTDATAAQTLTTGTAGTDFAILDNGTGDHKFNLPVASASNTGKLSSTDWSTFNSKAPSFSQGNLTDVGTDGITITGGTGSIIGSGVSISQHVSDSTHNGYLSSADWSTFNGKQNALTIGNLTDAGTDGIVVTGGSGAVIGSGTSIAQHIADTTHNGYLSSTDWNTFNGKQSALTIGNLTDAGTDGIIVTGGTGSVIGSGTSIAQHVADTTHNGYLSSTDWNTFNNKITSINGDTTKAQLISGSSPLKVDTAAGTTTISGPFSNFVYQQGGTATAPGGNIYTSWSTMMTDVNKVSGIINITFDNSFTSTPVIPAGSWNLAGVILHGNPLSPFTVNIADGCTFSTAPSGIDSALTLNSISTAHVFSIANTGQFNVGAECVLQALHFPMVNIPDGNFIFFLLNFNSIIANGGALCIDLNSTGALLALAINNSSINDDILVGGAGSFFEVEVDASSYGSTNQPSLSGSILLQFNVQAELINYDNSATDLVSVTVQDAITELAADIPPYQVNSLSTGSSISTAETGLISLSGVNLPITGNGVTVIAEGSFAATVNAKRVRFYANSHLIQDSGSIVLNNGRWRISAVILQSNATQIQANSQLTTNLTGLTDQLVRVTGLGSSENTPFTISVTGTGVANGDLTADLLVVTPIRN